MFNGTAFAPSGSNIFNLTQSWSELIQNASGSVNVIHNSQDEFYNGEFDGSVLTVTTQSLNAPFPNDVIDFSYTPVRYSPQNYGLSSTDPFAQFQFLNALTVPAQGEILLLRAYRRLLPDGSTGLSSLYVKIHKLDNSGFDNTIALGQATKLRIKYTTESGYLTIGNVVSRAEYPTYWLYQVQSLGSDTADNYIKDYSVSASNINPLSPAPSTQYILGSGNSFNTITGNSSGFYNSSTGYYTIPQTANVQLIISASITTDSTHITGNPFFALYSVDSSNSFTFLQSSSIQQGSNITTRLSSSYYPLGTEALIAFIQTPSVGSFTLKSGSLLVTQSIAPSAEENDLILIEPYITDPNFYNSDDNALLNSVSDQRPSTFTLDADYGYGITPINFGLLISGTAAPSTVPDSNYTSKKSTL
jgi:hypothetical protein